VKVITTNSINDGSAEGYEIVFSRIVDFSLLGVPQKRERLIVIGIRRDLLRGNAELLKSIKGMTERILSDKNLLFSTYPLTSIEVFEGRVLTELGDVYAEAMRKWEGVWEEVGTERAAKWKKEVWDKLTMDPVEDYN